MMLYLAGLVFFVLFFIHPELAWGYPYDICKYLALFFLTLQLVISFLKYDIFIKVVLLIVFFLVIVVGLKSQYLTLLYLTYALVIGAKGIDYRLILKAWLFVALAIFLISFLGSLMGLIPDNMSQKPADSLETMGLDSPISHSAGYLWTTGCAIHVSYICIVYWLLRKGRFNFFDLLLYLSFFWISFYYNKARQASLIILLIPFVSLYFHYKKKKNKEINPITYFGIMLCIPLFAILSIYASIAYDKTDLFWVGANVIFSSRLALGHDMIEQYGFTWFGQYIKMIGADVNLFYYNYIDSSYVQAYLLWGILLSTILLLLYIIILYNAYQRKDFILAFSVFLVALSSVTSQYLFQIYFCPFLIALFANHHKNKKYVYKRRIKKADIKSDSRVLS